MTSVIKTTFRGFSNDSAGFLFLHVMQRDLVILTILNISIQPLQRQDVCYVYVITLQKPTEICCLFSPQSIPPSVTG